MMTNTASESPTIVEAIDPGAVGLRVDADKAKGSTTVLFFRRDDVPADVADHSALPVPGNTPAESQMPATRATINQPRPSELQRAWLDGA